MQKNNRRRNQHHHTEQLRGHQGQQQRQWQQRQLQRHHHLPTLQSLPSLQTLCHQSRRPSRTNRNGGSSNLSSSYSRYCCSWCCYRRCAAAHIYCRPSPENNEYRCSNTGMAANRRLLPKAHRFGPHGGPATARASRAAVAASGAVDVGVPRSPSRCPRPTARGGAPQGASGTANRTGAAPAVSPSRATEGGCARPSAALTGVEGRGRSSVAAAVS